jgi:Flp pilus assembly pilin Flp
MWRQLWRDETGLTTIEYSLLLLVVATGTALAWTLLATAVSHSAGASVAKMPGAWRKELVSGPR